MTTDNENNPTAYPVVWVHKSIVDIAVTQTECSEDIKCANPRIPYMTDNDSLFCVI